jgi:hypothetical protein
MGPVRSETPGCSPLGIDAGITQDNHLLVKGFNQGMKSHVRALTLAEHRGLWIFESIENMP